MINKKIDEAIFDVLLENAFADAIEDDVRKLQEEAEPCTISSETDLKIRKMIAQVGKTGNQKRTRIIIRVASIVLVVLLNLSLIGILMIPSVNAEVKNVFSELFEKYESFQAKEQNSYIVTTSEYEIGYIPDKYELILNDDYQILFREINQGNGYISINISDEDFGRMSLDAENSASQTIKINGMDANLSSINNEYYLFWFNGYHFISIITNVDEQEMIKIAEEIENLQ